MWQIEEGRHGFYTDGVERQHQAEGSGSRSCVGKDRETKSHWAGVRLLTYSRELAVLHGVMSQCPVVLRSTQPPGH